MVKQRAIAARDLAAFSWSTAPTGRDSPAAMDLHQGSSGLAAAARGAAVADAPGRAEPDPAPVFPVLDEETVMPGIDIAAAASAVLASTTELNRWETDGGTWIT